MLIVEVSYGCPSVKYPGNGIFQFDQARALSGYGHQVIFVALDARSVRRWRRWGYSIYVKQGIVVLEYNVPIGPFFSRLRNALCKHAFGVFLDKIKSKYGKPDIVHVHFGNTAANIVETSIKEGIPYVVTEHSSGLNNQFLPIKEVNELRNTYSHAAKVIAVSKPLAQRIDELTGIKAVVIPNIIDFSLFKLNESTRKNPEKFRFITAGSLIPRKGFTVLLKAFRKVLETYPDSQLLIMGEGPERVTIESLISELGLSNSVKLFGAFKRFQFSEELKDSDAFVLASRGETFGVVYAEALACGVPVIATKCGGPEDFVNRTNGILVPINDLESLATAMLNVMQKKDQYNPQEIADDTFKKFSSEKVAMMLTDIFLESTRNSGCK